MGATWNYKILRKMKKLSSSKVLISFTILALICANIPIIKEWYFSLWQVPVSLSIGEFNFFSHAGHPLTFGELVNDMLMAIFFLSVGLEIKREIRNGELSTPQKAMLPVIGAIGGMIVPVLIFFLTCPDDPAMQRGLAIPMATDIAFSLGVLALFKSRVPIGLKVFLAALAVVDDLGGIIIIALFYSTDINFLYIGISAACVVAMIIGNKLKFRTLPFYITMGLILWYMMLNSGIHPTISGVIVAFCLPSNLRKMKGGELEHSLEFPINYIVIPLFAFANAGIDLSEMNVSDLVSGVGFSVISGLVFGKLIGVFLFSWIAVKLKVVSLPEGATWKSFASVCVICGIGFTVSMFIADLSFAGIGEYGESLLAQAKLGVLFGSLMSAVLGIVFLNKTLPQKQISK